MRTCCFQAQKLHFSYYFSGVPEVECFRYLPTGMADFHALDALKTSSNSGSSSSSSSCTSVLQAAMMIPDLSTFVTTAQVCC